MTIIANNEWKVNKINEISDYFIVKIQEGELMCKRLSKYIAAFDCFDKTLNVLSSTGGVISIASFARFIGTHVELTGASLVLHFL